MQQQQGQQVMGGQAGGIDGSSGTVGKQLFVKRSCTEAMLKVRGRDGREGLLQGVAVGLLGNSYRCQWSDFVIEGVGRRTARVQQPPLVACSRWHAAGCGVGCTLQAR